MNLAQYQATPAAIRNAAFVQARKDWLSILLHDWHNGALDMFVPDFLAHGGVDIFNLSDVQIAEALPKFAGKMANHYVYRYEAVNMLTSLGMPANFALAAIDQSYNYDQENGDLRELLWEHYEDGDEYRPTAQTGTSILIAYNTMKDMMVLENGMICLDGEPLYSSSGINLVWLKTSANEAPEAGNASTVRGYENGGNFS